MFDYIDWYEERLEAIEYFVQRKREEPEVCRAVAMLKGSLYGIPDGAWKKEYLDAVRDFLDDLCWKVEWYDEESDKFVFVDYIYARDHKAAVVGKELAPYV